MSVACVRSRYSRARRPDAPLFSSSPYLNLISEMSDQCDTLYTGGRGNTLWPELGNMYAETYVVGTTNAFVNSSIDSKYLHVIAIFLQHQSNNACSHITPWLYKYEWTSVTMILTKMREKLIRSYVTLISPQKLNFFQCVHFAPAFPRVFR